MSKLTIEEFQSLLEREFVQFVVCIELFDSSHTAKYQNKMEEHYHKITDISGKLGSPNIFTNSNLLDMNIIKVLPFTGIPEFIYRTPEAREGFGTVIKLTTFQHNTPAVYEGGEAPETVKILKNYASSGELQVQFKDGSIEEYPYNQFTNPISSESIHSQINNFILCKLR